MAGENIDLYTSGQKKVLNNLTGQLNRQIGEGIAPYEGATVPGVNALQRDALGRSAGMGSYGQDTSGALSQLLSGAGDPQGVQNYYQSQLGAADQAFRDQMRNVGNQYGDTYGRSGGLMRGMSEALSRYGVGQQQNLGQLVFNDRNAARDRQGLGVGLANQDVQQNAQNIQQQYQMGEQQRGIQGQQNAGQFAQWQQGQAYNNPWLNLINPVLSAQPFAPTQEGMGTFGQVMSGIGGTGQAIGGLAGLFA